LGKLARIPKVLAVAVMPVSRLRMVMARLLVPALMALAAGPAGAQDAGWLYTVDVPVADQSQEARRQGARAALEVVLGRLTGQADLAADPRVRSAFGSPDRYYNRFGYAVGATPDETLLRVQFSPPALFELIRSAGLPIWPSTRPVVRAWLVVDAQPGPRLAAAQTDDALRAAFAKRALERGLPVRIGSDEDSPAPARPESVQPAPADQSGTPPAAAAMSGAAGPNGPVGVVEAPLQVGPDADAAPGATTAADPTAVTRLPDDVALRPAVLPGDPVWPTLGLWDAAAVEVAAIVPERSGELPLVARIGAVPTGGWIARWEVVEAPPAPSPAVADGAPGAGAPDPAATAETGAQVPLGATATGDVATGMAGVTASAAAVDATGADVEAEPPASVVFEARRATPEILAAAVIDGLVDHLLARYQVQAGSSQVLAVAVDGIRDARAYAQVLALFGDVEVIDDVAVVGAAGDRIRFALTTIAALEQVATLVTAGGRLVRDATFPAPVVATAPATGSAFFEVLPRDPAAPVEAVPPGAQPAAEIEPAAAIATEGDRGAAADEVPPDLVLYWRGS
jgi:hypothetical protein